MKSKGFSIGIIFLVSMVYTTCTEGKALHSTEGESSALKSVEIEGAVIDVPAPSGGDDTDEIEAKLLEAVSAGSGSVVQLAEGTYYISRGIRVDGFDGYIKGAGKDKTIIEILPGEKIDGEPIEGWGGKRLSYLLYFYGGNIQMSDLSFMIIDPEPAGDQDNDFSKALYCLIVISGEAYTSISTSFDNMGFIGESGYFFGKNVAHGVHIFYDPDSEEYLDGGSHSLTNCEFKSMYISYNGFTFKNTTWLIGGSPDTGNRFINTCFGPIIEDIGNSEVEISYNTLENIDWIGIYLLQYLHSGLSSYVIEHNKIDVISGGDGIIVKDQRFWSTGQKAIDARISYNNISMSTFSGGIGVPSGNGTNVINNVISGEGLGIYSFAGFELKIIGNNVQNVTPVPILLFDDTQNCIVVGGYNKSNVVDWGIDNILTDINIIEGSALGPKISDAVKKKIESMRPGF